MTSVPATSTNHSHDSLSVLPHGDAPAALSSPYFPDRVHEYVWRNWNLVEPAKLGKIIGATAEEITQVGLSMGLPPVAAPPPEMLKRGYVSLIRRNWHLLPYLQLLELMEMTPDALSFALREDDFLWVKLGRRKPQCEPLRYQAPNEAAQRRAAEIRALVETEFGAELQKPTEPRFDFVRQLSAPLPTGTPSPERHSQPLRLVYSYLALYGDALANPKLDPYPDAFLERLAQVGVNGVWLHGVLRELASGGAAFPEFGHEASERLTNMRALVERAAKHGVGVYLYLNEPRAMPESFYQSRPELAGVRQEELRAMCTSQPAVRKWMADALTEIFTAVPGLAGVYCISASENLTSCASLGGWKECPHCRDRSDDEIIAEVIATIEAGVHRASPNANVVISDWGWKGHGDARELIALLPKSVWLVSASEWALEIERGGVRSKVGEYAISAVGPGPRALQHWEAARANGNKIVAEIQFNNTCEIAVVPYLPVLDLIAEHLQNLAPLRPDGMFIGWTMGGHPSPNYELARRLTESENPDVETILTDLARDRFGPEGAPHARRAWTLFSEGFREYPYHISTIYTSPVSNGPANPLYATRTGYSATMWGIPYDDVDGWRGPYPAEVLAAQFELVANRWAVGIAELTLAVAKAPAERREEVQADLRYARATAITFQSVANQTRFIQARDALAKLEGTTPSEQRHHLTAEMKRCAEAEIGLAHELLALVREDSRIGFEPSCQYFYLPLDLVEKVVNCRWLLSQMES